MAADKKAYLRNAQKQVQKGQLDKAITSYRAILKLDPKDVKVHNTLGDIYIRCNQKKEGINEYLWVAEYYEKDGFTLRSIAILQKILNLDPSLVEVRLKLADLYAQQKLAAEAKTRYLEVADYYDKKGKVAEALEVFGKIADLDPSNLGVRVKLGKMYLKQDLPGKASEEFVRAAEGYIKQKNFERVTELLNRALKLKPESESARRCLAEFHASREEWAEAVKCLTPFVEQESPELEALKLYAAACMKVDKIPEAITALEMAHKSEPGSMPLRSLLGRAYLKGEKFDKAFDLYSPSIGDYLKDNKIEAAEVMARELADNNPESDRAQQKLLEVVQKKGDREEMLRIYRTLGDIYRGKGLERNAAGVLEKYLEIRPDDREVEKLLQELKGEAAAVAGAEVEAPPPPPEDAVSHDMDVELIDLEGEELAGLSDLDITVEEPVDEVRTEAAAAVKAEAAAPPAETEEEEEELVFEAEELEAPDAVEVEVSAEEVSLEPTPGSIERQVDLEHAVDEGVEEGLAELEKIGEPEAAAEEEAPPAEETPPAFDAVLEGVEEVDLEQDLSFSADEAATLLDESISDAEISAAAEASVEEALEQEPEVQEAAPVYLEEPAAEELIEEPAAVSGELIEEPAVAPEEPAGEPVPSPAELDFDLDALKDTVETETPVAEVTPEPAPAHTDEMEDFLAEADFYFQQGLFDEAEFLYRKLCKLAPDNQDLAERLRKLEEEKGRPAEAPASTEPEVAAPRLEKEEIFALESDLDRTFAGQTAPTGENGMKVSVTDGTGAGEERFTDFMSELRQELDREEAAEEAAGEPAVQGEESLNEIFKEFQEGLKEQLGEEDFETHYNLGIAYKEMGLLKEALGEFVLAEKSPARQLDSLNMLALCHRELGEEEAAAGRLEEGLALAEEGSDEQKGFLYELSDLYRQAGREGESVDMLQRIHAIDDSYRDVAARLEALGVEARPPRETPKEEEAKPSTSKKPKVSYL